MIQTGQLIMGTGCGYHAPPSFTRHTASYHLPYGCFFCFQSFFRHALHSLRRCFFGGGFQYNRIYSPVSFGKKYDPDGKYIRHFLPVLKGN